MGGGEQGLSVSRLSGFSGSCEEEEKGPGYLIRSRPVSHATLRIARI